jgi:signal transduction histidine kinase
MVESSIPPQRSAGIGIDGAHLELLLQPFKQVDSSMSQGNGGIGPGLSTTRQLVELMQGVIGDSRRKDLGSQFCVEIDLAIAQSSPRGR